MHIASKKAAKQTFSIVQIHSSEASRKKNQLFSFNLPEIFSGQFLKQKLSSQHSARHRISANFVIVFLIVMRISKRTKTGNEIAVAAEFPKDFITHHTVVQKLLGSNQKCQAGWNGQLRHRNFWLG
jgi:hypothetical protein